MSDDPTSGEETPDEFTPKKKNARQGNPPEEYRWKKGCPSPNPTGRPKKRHLKGLFAKIDPLAAQVIAHDTRVIGVIDGEDITNGDAFLLTLSKRQAKDTGAARLYERIRSGAYKAAEEVKMLMFTAAVAHKEQYAERFELHETLGKRPPNILPHPADIIIDDDCNVRVVGPVDKKAQDVLEQILKLRDQLIDAGVLLASPKEHALNEPAARKLWLQLRRRFYRLNPAIPPRLRRPFPRFETASQ